MLIPDPCRLWRDVILSGSGKFWRWAQLLFFPSLYPSQADDLLTSRILYLVPRIWISPNTNMEESLLEAVSEDYPVKAAECIACIILYTMDGNIPLFRCR